MIEVVFSVLDLFENCLMVRALERLVAAHENIKNASHGPTVYLCVIGFSLDDLRRHVAWRSSHNLFLLNVINASLGKSEVNKLKIFFVTGDQNVLWLDVSMNYAL